LGCSQGGDYQYADLAKFGYKNEGKFKNINVYFVLPT
jgi:hypothetical protein